MKTEFVSIHSLKITHPVLADIIQISIEWRNRLRRHPKLALILVGPNGTGKTHIARALLWADCYTYKNKPVGYSGWFVKSDKLMRLMRDEEVESVVPNVPLIVIDDVGGESVIKHISADMQKYEIQDIFTRVVDYCYTRGIGIIITGSNNCGTIENLEQYVGPRAWDRLEEMAPKNGRKSYMLNLVNVPRWRRRMGGRGVHNE